MAITDAERRHLHSTLDRVLGKEDAAVLISHLPPFEWSDLAKTSDVQAVHGKVDVVGHDLQGEIQRVHRDLHGEIQSVRDDLQGQIHSVSNDLHGQIQSVRDDLQGEIHSVRRDLQGEMQGVRNDLEQLEVRIGLRFAVVDERFALVDERFATLAARFDASLERSLREQNNRFLLAMGGMLTMATTAQAIVAKLLGG